MTSRFFNPRGTKRYRSRLRRRMTSQESMLWLHIKGYQVAGIRFRTQTGIGRYIADFFSFDRFLAIELDGGHHNWPEVAAYDRVRDRIIRENGITVLRFPNDRVDKDIYEVVEEIRKVATSLPRRIRGKLVSPPSAKSDQECPGPGGRDPSSARSDQEAPLPGGRAPTVDRSEKSGPLPGGRDPTVDRSVKDGPLQGGESSTDSNSGGESA